MNNNTYSKVLQAKEAHEDELLKLNGVYGVGIGFKVIDGKMTDELAISVFTSSKKGKNLLSEDQLIPSSFDGIVTDVVEAKQAEPLPLFPREDNGRTALGIDDKKYRPIPGGAEIVMPLDPPYASAGTLGMFARSTKPGDAPDDIYILSNAHCFPRPNQQILQGGEKVATASRIVSSPVVDGGIARLDKPTNADLGEIVDIGSICGTHILTPSDFGANVIKRGRTTETTSGYIRYTEMSVNEKRHQIAVSSNEIFCNGGDSGSVVLMKDGANKHQVIGLLWGMTPDHELAFLSPIKAVEEELQIKICASPIGVTYNAHVQSNGWLPYVADGQIAGTTGESRRLEAVKIRLTGCDIPNAKIRYRVHVQSIGWLPYVCDDAVSGTTGESRRAEAIQITLENMPDYSVVYRAHMQNLGWSAWVHDDAVAGTTGESRRIEAIQVYIEKK